MIRITSGYLRGRLVETPGGRDTRPTQSRLRQALFNSIQNNIGDARVLDLFAGSGALGFEAVSRGAGQVVFVDSARRAARLIDRNASSLGVKDKTRILCSSVEDVWNKLLEAGPFDVVVADPPYAAYPPDVLVRVLSGAPLGGLLAPGAVVCIEWGVAGGHGPGVMPERVSCLVKTREKHYGGDSVLTTYVKDGGGGT
ncbi:MAG: 16S rRNA (guanine(966)-N(2))-methyltransferase RsmD [Bdellovibrionales bacterium RIFOXYD1_FULL_53_11]|nr:MAG: 16S rRNA (guanine(966)-N(2))-methyltransferase RsmD [Bdellovibrionales bacterium RIFOXYD1_FULL_53_11]